MFGQFLDSNPGLQEFLDRPSVQEAFKAHRLDQSLVELALRAAAAHELAQVARQWKPESVASQTSVMPRRATCTSSRAAARAQRKPGEGFKAGAP